MTVHRKEAWPGRTCAWCGKPGGTCMSVLKARCDRAGVKLRGRSQRYFHPGRCVELARKACDKGETAWRKAAAEQSDSLTVKEG